MAHHLRQVEHNMDQAVAAGVQVDMARNSCALQMVAAAQVRNSLYYNNNKIL